MGAVSFYAQSGLTEEQEKAHVLHLSMFTIDSKSQKQSFQAGNSLSHGSTLYLECNF